QSQGFAVTAVRVRLHVALMHRGDRADRNGLLSLAEVGRSLDLAGREELLNLLLEDPDLHHLPVPPSQRLCRQLTGPLSGRHGAGRPPRSGYAASNFIARRGILRVLGAEEWETR